MLAFHQITAYIASLMGSFMCCCASIFLGFANTTEQEQEFTPSRYFATSLAIAMFAAAYLAWENNTLGIAITFAVLCLCIACIARP